MEIARAFMIGVVGRRLDPGPGYADCRRELRDRRGLHVDHVRVERCDEVRREGAIFDKGIAARDAGLRQAGARIGQGIVRLDVGRAHRPCAGRIMDEIIGSPRAIVMLDSAREIEAVARECTQPPGCAKHQHEVGADQRMQPRGRRRDIDLADSGRRDDDIMAVEIQPAHRRPDAVERVAFARTEGVGLFGKRGKDQDAHGTRLSICQASGDLSGGEGATRPVPVSVAKERRAVQMFSPLRCIFWFSAATASLAAAPAHAAAMAGILTEVQGYASEAAWAIAVYAKAVTTGDMPHIRATSFMLSGFIGLVGLWLLVARPRIQLAEFHERADKGYAAEPAEAASVESEADRPTRLLEAIAAAKAQMSISEAEKKHSR